MAAGTFPRYWRRWSGPCHQPRLTKQARLSKVMWGCYEFQLDRGHAPGIGTLGRVAYQHEQSPYFADGHITIVRGVQGVDPMYVSLFLQTRIGRALVERRQRGSSGQMEVYPSDIAAIPVPRLGLPIVEDVVRLWTESRSSVAESSRLLVEAKRLLVSALGLAALDLSVRQSQVERLVHVSTANRLDAEFACVPDLARCWKPPFPLKPLGARPKSIDKCHVLC